MLCGALTKRLAAWPSACVLPKHCVVPTCNQK
jgi:hypothetical protein